MAIEKEIAYEIVFLSIKGQYRLSKAELILQTSLYFMRKYTLDTLIMQCLHLYSIFSYQSVSSFLWCVSSFDLHSGSTWISSQKWLPITSLEVGIIYYYFRGILILWLFYVFESIFIYFHGLHCNVKPPKRAFCLLLVHSTYNPTHQMIKIIFREFVGWINR